MVSIALSPIDELRYLVAQPFAQIIADTGELDAMRDAARTAGAFKVKGGATFQPCEAHEANGYAVSTSVDRDGQGEPRRIVVTIYGTMTYRDRTDNGAKVTVSTDNYGGQWHPFRAWTTSSAWNGKTFAPMPDGARDAVAEVFRDKLSRGEFDLSAIIAERRMLDRQHNQEAHIAAAIRAMREAAQA